ncbi:MAG: VapC toxin family PIN domain ribonuclease [Rhodocyclaceae bacterium]|jgi:toxin-antitoxin system PIN domain toxin|nr:VapC toxin family PIN domain ribonuclease [Rhodocyclaceae bacterium]
MRALLDVNVLIALLDEGHLHHAAARDWLSRNIKPGWASCPLTQNGCIRILSQPAYPGALPPAAVAARLTAATTTDWHVFWPDSLSLLDGGSVNWDGVLGSRQVTDIYLLALAVNRGGRLVTFDRAIPLQAVPGVKPKHLVVI